MSSSNRSNRTKFRISIMLGLMLLLCFSVSKHLVDTAPHHHNSHHCELFSAHQFSTSHELPKLVAPLLVFFPHVAEAVQPLKRLYFAYLARSPPVKAH